MDKNKKWDYHVHTTFSDGSNTAREMAQKAIEIGLDGLCFCDHCRHDSDWLDVYAEEIRRIGEEERGRLCVMCAVEAKAINHKGELDVPKELPSGILRLAAIHRIPNGHGAFIRGSEIEGCREYALECWMKTVEGLSDNALIDRFVHPFSLLGKLGISAENEQFWKWLDTVFSKSHYLLENNVKYDSSMVPNWFEKRYRERMLPSSDSHSVTALEESYRRLYPRAVKSNS